MATSRWLNLSDTLFELLMGFFKEAIMVMRQSAATAVLQGMVAVAIVIASAPQIGLGAERTVLMEEFTSVT